jgi:ribosome-associated heat shock protein Hsp15
LVAGVTLVVSSPQFRRMHEATTIRLDLWLWAARFYRTRSLAKQAVDNGKVDVGGQRAKPSRTVRVGDAMRIARGDEIFEIEVLVLSDQRGPASVACLLYAESEASKARRLETIASLRAGRAGYQPPNSKPDKRARRLIRALGDIDAS